jgi:hypothetical protein
MPSIFRKIRQLFDKKADPVTASAPVVPTVLDDVPTRLLAEELARRLPTVTDPALQRELHDTFYARDYHLLRKHFYLPIPDDTDGLDAGFWDRLSELPGLDMNDSRCLDFVDNVLPPYLSEFRTTFPNEGSPEQLRFYLVNGGYMAVDAHVYYSLIRHLKPKRIIEIGAGNSTWLVSETLKKNRAEGASTHFTSIDPYPWDIFKNGWDGLDELICKPIQQVKPELFDSLDAGDILFIDSTHVIRSGNDVHYEYLEILPRLRSGVHVHVHDISLPKPYPKVYFDNHLYWNEQYLLQAFLAFNSAFEVVWPGNYMMVRHPEKMHATFPEIEIMRRTYPSSEPTAFWMRVRP